MQQKIIHINCDLGEGGNDDAEIMPLISACNIACGGHAGTLKSMENTVKSAMKNQVEIGAHPSYPDKINFGRKPLTIGKEELKRSLVDQILSLKRIIEAEGGKLNHIKPHGALYHEISKNEEIAKLFLELVLNFKEVPAIYAPEKSVISKLTTEKINIVFEAFADRNYAGDRSLVPRKNPKALLTQKEHVFEQLSNMFFDHKIRTENGFEITCSANTFCLHSDTPNAVKILKYLRQEFEAMGIQIYHYEN